MTTEAEIQRDIVIYLRSALRQPALVWSVPNAPRSAITGAQLKATGMVKGAPDLCIMADRTMIFAEVKRPASASLGGKKKPAGRMSPEQIVFRDVALACGFKHCILYSVEDAVNLVRALRLGKQEAA